MGIFQKDAQGQLTVSVLGNRSGIKASKLVRDVINVLVTCKYEEDLDKTQPRCYLETDNLQCISVLCWN